jgi:hypothetical protein
VQLTTSIGPGTTLANAVFSATIPGTSVPFPPGEVSIPASLSLGPGTYYLVLSSPGVANGYAWITAFNVLPSNVGTVGQGYYCCFPNPVGIFPPAETFKTLAGNIVAGPTQFYFALEGQVPEPGTLLLLSSGLMGLTAIRRRRQCA